MKRITALLVVLFIVAPFGLRVVAQDAPTPDVDFYNGNILKNSSQAADFFDNPENYTGKTIQLVLFCDARDGLRQCVGYNTPFEAYIDAPSEMFYITIPEGMKVPNAKGMDRLMVIFKCSQGSLRKGNVALSITRY